MQVTFDVNGENVQVGPLGTTPQKLGSISSNPIYLNTPSGYTPVQGTMASGSSADFPILGTANGHYIGFFQTQSPTILVTKFQMDDETAVTNGLSNLAAALQGDDLAVILSSDGSVATAS